MVYRLINLECASYVQQTRNLSACMLIGTIIASRKTWHDPCMYARGVPVAPLLAFGMVLAYILLGMVLATCEAGTLFAWA